MCYLSYILSTYSTIKTNVNCTGNVVNGTIGKQMVDTLVESASNVEVHIFRIKVEFKITNHTFIFNSS